MIHFANVGSPDFQARSGNTGRAMKTRSHAIGRCQWRGMSATVQRNATQRPISHQERSFDWP